MIKELRNAACRSLNNSINARQTIDENPILKRMHSGKIAIAQHSDWRNASAELKA